MTPKTVLMVEGKDDEHVVMHICGTRSLGKIDSIKQYGGKDPLLDAIGARLKQSDLHALGILMDADQDVSARWDAISSRLRSAGYTNTPVQPDLSGTVLESPPGLFLPRVGVWLMPDNKLTGIMEDFLAFLVAPGDPLLNHVEKSMQEIPHGICRFDNLNKAKAKIHTWLAWQSEPGKPLGQAISSKYLDAGLPSADVFSNWLRRMFFTDTIGSA